MSHDDRALDFETRFQERKQELYRCLDEENSKYLEDKTKKHLTDDVKFVFYLVDRIVDQLELSQHYGQGNGEIKINNLFKDSGDIIKATKKVFYAFLKIIKPRVLYFLHVDLSCFYFVACKDRNIDLRMWFESVEESKVLNHFLGNKELEENESEYKIDNTDYCKLIINGSCTNISIDDKDCSGSVKELQKKEISTEITRKYRPDFIKKAKRIIQSSRVFKEAEKRTILQINKGFLNYKIPKSYTQWDDLTDLMIAAVSLSVSDVENSYRDYSSLLAGSSVLSWLSNNSPLFIVKKELIDVFTKSEINTIDCSVSDSFVNELFSSFELIYPNILFLFPLDCECLYDAFFGRIDHCFVGKSTEHYSLILSKNKNDPIFSVNTITTGKFPLNTAISTKGNEYDGIDKTDSQKAPIFISRKIIAQCLLLIASKPELVITSDQIKSFNYETSGQGFQKPKNGDKVLYPRVLNLSYAEKKIRSDDNRIQRQGNYSPKSPHWRLGYEVNKPVGKMKGVPKEQWERKKIKVAPYFVLGGDDKDDSTEGLSSVGSEFKKTIDNNQEF